MHLPENQDQVKEKKYYDDPNDVASAETDKGEDDDGDDQDVAKNTSGLTIH